MAPAATYDHAMIPSEGSTLGGSGKALGSVTKRPGTSCAS